MLQRYGLPRLSPRFSIDKTAVNDENCRAARAIWPNEGGIRKRAETGLADCHVSNFVLNPSSAEKQLPVPAQLRVTSNTNGEYMKALRAHFCCSLLALFLAAL